MFKNSSGTLKILAMILFILCCVAYVIVFLIEIIYIPLLGIIILAVGPIFILMSYIVCSLIYGFSEIMESTAASAQYSHKIFDKLHTCSVDDKKSTETSDPLADGLSLVDLRKQLDEGIISKEDYNAILSDITRNI